jgi:hypothetical protein
VWIWPSGREKRFILQNESFLCRNKNRLQPEWVQPEDTISSSSLEIDEPASLSALSITSRASLTQLPHCVPQPVRELRSRKLLTPSLTDCHMAESLTALQIQTYMDEAYSISTHQLLTQIINANENDCQSHKQSSQTGPAFLRFDWGAASGAWNRV